MKYARVIENRFRVTHKSGDEFQCMCPFHDDTSTGHLYANAVKGLYVCFSCGAKGRVDNLDGVGAINADINDVRKRIKAMRTKKSQTYYPEAWLDQFDIPHPYWTEERGLPESVVERFRLGFDPFSNRLTLPLRDARGRILGVTYRRLDDGRPKYLHPKGFPVGRHLYGAWLLRDERKVALVEGQVDAIRCWSARVPAVSLMGSRVTPDQVKVLQRCGIRTVVLMLDNDNAGITGSVSIHEAMAGSGIRVQAGWYRDYWVGVKDPDALTDTRLRKMFHSSVPMFEWARKVALL